MAPANPSSPLTQIGRWHDVLVHQRRVRVLARMLAAWIPPSSKVLDIGCGDGTVGSLIAGFSPGISIEGVEVAARPSCRIPCREFDGSSLPCADGAFDLCVLVDVLHHTADVRSLLREAARASRRHVLIKDHLDENGLDRATLRLMDWVGNRPHGVVLPYNYQSRAEWQSHFAACGLREVNSTSNIPLYPAPFSWVFGRKLHFIALLEKA